MSLFIIVLIALFGFAIFSVYISNKQKIFNGVIIQALETVHLLDTTVKCDVFRSRFAFLEKIAPTLIERCHLSSYPKWLKIACDEYKKRYYDRNITEHQKQILANPEQIITTEFKGQQYVAWYIYYCNAKEKEIAALKTEPAKQRRRDEALETAKYLLGDLMQREYYSYHSQITKELLRFGINMNINYSKRPDIVS